MLGVGDGIEVMTGGEVDCVSRMGLSSTASFGEIGVLVSYWGCVVSGFGSEFD